VIFSDSIFSPTLEAYFFSRAEDATEIAVNRRRDWHEKQDEISTCFSCRWERCLPLPSVHGQPIHTRFRIVLSSFMGSVILQAAVPKDNKLYHGGICMGARQYLLAEKSRGQPKKKGSPCGLPFATTDFCDGITE
jgi:hypothetical protein